MHTGHDEHASVASRVRRGGGEDCDACGDNAPSVLGGLEHKHHKWIYIGIVVVIVLIMIYFFGKMLLGDAAGDLKKSIENNARLESAAITGQRDIRR
jgi:hypothetical protein